MILDCFTFYNELDLLELRLRELSRVVDQFIAIQGDETHAGDPKPLYLDPTEDRWAPWKGRLSSFVVPRMPTDSRWEREYAMRHAKTEALAVYADDAVVVLSDVDEIPDKALLPDVVRTVTDTHWVGFLPHCYYYYLNLRCQRPLAACPCVRLSTLRRRSARWIEHEHKHDPVNPVVGGWHFSYMGGVEAIQAKIRAYAHAEYDTPHFNDPARIQARIDARLDLFRDRAGRLTPVPLSEMPEEVQTHPERYRHLMLPGTLP